MARGMVCAAALSLFHARDSESTALHEFLLQSRCSQTLRVKRTPSLDSPDNVNAYVEDLGYVGSGNLHSIIFGKLFTTSALMAPSQFATPAMVQRASPKKSICPNLTSGLDTIFACASLASSVQSTRSQWSRCSLRFQPDCLICCFDLQASRNDQLDESPLADPPARSKDAFVSLGLRAI